MSAAGAVTPEELAAEALAERDTSVPLTIRLQDPITLKGKTISELVMQPMTGRHYVQLDMVVNGTPAFLMKLASLLCGISVPMISKVSARDANTLMAEAGFFFAGSQQTGTKEPAS